MPDMTVRGRKILIVTINYWPELTGIGKYTAEMAEWLVQHGADVKVITAPPYYPAWRVAAGYSGWRYSSEIVNDVHVVRCPLWVPGKPNGLKRILHLASFALAALPVVLWSGFRWRPDAVFAIEPPLFCAPGALLAARLCGAKAWLHIQDFEVDAAFELGILKSAWLRRLVLRGERMLMRRFDHLSTISDRMLDRLVAKKTNSEGCILFPNWVELDRIRPLSTPSALRSAWGFKDAEVIVLYSGNMGEKQGLEILIEVARGLVHEDNIRFVLCGDGAARSRLVKSAEGLSNVVFKPLQPIDSLNDLMNLADIHVLPQRADAADLVLPSKLTNMLASGRPVVATAETGTQVAELLDGCGIVVPPGNAQLLSEAIVSLSASSGQRHALGAEARSVAERLWDKERLLSGVFSIIR